MLVSDRKVFQTAEHSEAVVARLRLLGLVGAVLLLVGPALAGWGFAAFGGALQAQNQCTSSCGPLDSQALNASIQVSLYIGAGIVVGGLGLSLVLAGAMILLERAAPPEWATRSSAGETH